jgi:outer membrane protein assembly factor BamB
MRGQWRFGTRDGYWRAAGRLGLGSVGPKGKGHGQQPVVGSRAIAIGFDADFVRVLERRSLAMAWRGRLKNKLPVTWVDPDHLALEGRDEGVGAWTLSSQTAAWWLDDPEAELLGGFCAWRGLLLCARPSMLELRQAHNGEVQASWPLGSRRAVSAFVCGDHAVCWLEDPPETIACVSLATGDRVWERTLGRGDWEQVHDPAFHLWAGGGTSTMIIQWGNTLAALRPEDGSVVWRRQVRFDLGGDLATRGCGRLASVVMGRFVMVDEGTGSTLADYLAGGRFEGRGVVVGDVLVTPSHAGTLATHSLLDGRLVSLQEERVGFGGATYADGRLYVGADDGSLRVLEVNPGWDPADSPPTRLAWEFVGDAKPPVVRE